MLAHKLITPQASSSGTSIDFTGIPAGVRRITIMLIGVSTNGASALAVRVGDTNGITTSGYVSTVCKVGNAVATVAASDTARFLITTLSDAAAFYNGKIVLDLEESTGSNWVCSSIVASLGVLLVFTQTGYVQTGVTLDRVRVTTVNGSDTFDAGEIAISYE